MIYVALLRGVNVGGGNKVGMKELVVGMEAAGLKSVSSYINSGNIIFSDGTQSPENLSKIISEIIKDLFALEIKVLVKSHEEIAAIAKSIPVDWLNDDHMKCDVLFLWDSHAHKNIEDKLNLRDGVDSIVYVEQTVIWRVMRRDIGKSGLLKLVGTEFYKHMTIRNCNTVRKLLVKMDAVE